MNWSQLLVLNHQRYWACKKITIRSEKDGQRCIFEKVIVILYLRSLKFL